MNQLGCWRWQYFIARIIFFVVVATACIAYQRHNFCALIISSYLIRSSSSSLYSLWMLRVVLLKIRVLFCSGESQVVCSGNGSSGVTWLGVVDGDRNLWGIRNFILVITGGVLFGVAGWYRNSWGMETSIGIRWLMRGELLQLYFLSVIWALYVSILTVVFYHGCLFNIPF